jgi:hypothetical protein
MAIYRLLQNSAFAPENIASLVAAYEDCLRTLKLSDRSDPITEIVAKKIIETRRPEYGIRPGSVGSRFRKSEFPGLKCGPLMLSAGLNARGQRAGATVRLMQNGQPHEVRLSVSGPCVRLPRQ